jgi:hypothetical protein
MTVPKNGSRKNLKRFGIELLALDCLYFLFVKKLDGYSTEESGLRPKSFNAPLYVRHHTDLRVVTRLSLFRRPHIPAMI